MLCARRTIRPALLAVFSARLFALRLPSQRPSVFRCPGAAQRSTGIGPRPDWADRRLGMKAMVLPLCVLACVGGVAEARVCTQGRTVRDLADPLGGANDLNGDGVFNLSDKERPRDAMPEP